MRRSVFLPLAVLACTPHDGRAPTAPAACEQPWMAAWASDEELEVRACRMLELDDDEAPEAVAQLCDAEGWRAVYLIDDAEGRWAVRHDGWGHVSVCGTDVLADGATAIPMHDVGPGEYERQDVALTDGRPAVVVHEYAAARDLGEPAIVPSLGIERISAR